LTTDVEKAVCDLLTTYWNTGNVAKPVPIFYKDDQANYSASAFAIKVYLVDAPEATPHGLGWTSKEQEWRVSIDIKGPDRDRMLKTVDEVIRVLDSKRVGSGTDYDLLNHDGGMKVSGFAGFYHFVVDVKLKKLRIALP
jgi:hypothetical protein